MINHAIGAAGVMSQECKTVVAEYGQTILNLLLAEVSTICNLLLPYFFFISFCSLSQMVCLKDIIFF